MTEKLTLQTHTHPFNGPFSGTTRVGRYQKGKTNLDFAEARDSEWQWHQLGHMQVCISLQTDNHASTSPLSFLQAGCPSCHPTNSVKALKAFNFQSSGMHPSFAIPLHNNSYKRNKKTIGNVTMMLFNRHNKNNISQRTCVSTNDSLRNSCICWQILESADERAP